MENINLFSTFRFLEDFFVFKKKLKQLIISIHKNCFVFQAFLFVFFILLLFFIYLNLKKYI